MNSGCFKPDEFKGLAADDPRRAHLENCLRCRSVLKSFEVYRNVADVPDGAEVADAHARLAAAGGSGSEELEEQEVGGSSPKTRTSGWLSRKSVHLKELFTKK